MCGGFKRMIVKIIQINEEKIIENNNDPTQNQN
jgi:hypothetical protein